MKREDHAAVFIPREFRMQLPKGGEIWIRGNYVEGPIRIVVYPRSGSEGLYREFFATPSQALVAALLIQANAFVEAEEKG